MKITLSVALTTALAFASSDWSRVQALTPGSLITVHVAGQQHPEQSDEFFIDASADSVTVLVFRDRRVPKAARKDPVLFASAHPEFLQTIAMADVALISRQIKVRGPGPGAISPEKMAVIAAGATLLVAYGVLAVCKDECSDALLGGIAIGIPAAAAVWTATRSASHRETEIIYRAP